MNVGIYLNYIGLGSNLLHLSYCHEIAKKYGPVTIITLCKNLDQALEDDPNIKSVVLIDKNNCGAIVLQKLDNERVDKLHRSQNSWKQESQSLGC